MRKKIAMRWRREALRRGAIITNEKPVFTKKELREYGLRKKDNGFKFDVFYKGYHWMICADDMLTAYKMFFEEMDYEPERIKRAIEMLNSIPEVYLIKKEELEAVLPYKSNDDYPCDNYSKSGYCDGWESRFCCTLCKYLGGGNCDECDPMDI